MALVAIDPHTGEVKALAGGRNYGVSQLNHVLAKRQPGSIFKPFVYAAALDTAVDGSPRVFTASTTVVDEPTIFWFDEKSYTPAISRTNTTAPSRCARRWRIRSTTPP